MQDLLDLTLFSALSLYHITLLPILSYLALLSISSSPLPLTPILHFSSLHFCSLLSTSSDCSTSPLYSSSISSFLISFLFLLGRWSGQILSRDMVCGGQLFLITEGAWNRSEVLYKSPPGQYDISLSVHFHYENLSSGYLFVFLMLCDIVRTFLNACVRHWWFQIFEAPSTCFSTLLHHTDASCQRITSPHTSQHTTYHTNPHHTTSYLTTLQRITPLITWHYATSHLIAFVPSLTLFPPPVPVPVPVLVFVTLFISHMQIDPGFTYAHTLCGHELANNEDLDKAVQAFRNSLLHDDRHYNAWWAMSTCTYACMCALFLK